MFEIKAELNIGKCSSGDVLRDIHQKYIIL